MYSPGKLGDPSNESKKKRFGGSCAESLLIGEPFALHNYLPDESISTTFDRLRAHFFGNAIPQGEMHTVFFMNGTKSGRFVLAQTRHEALNLRPCEPTLDRRWALTTSFFKAVQKMGRGFKGCTPQRACSNLCGQGAGKVLLMEAPRLLDHTTSRS